MHDGWRSRSVDEAAAGNSGSWEAPLVRLRHRAWEEVMRVILLALDKTRQGRSWRGAPATQGAAVGLGVRSTDEDGFSNGAGSCAGGARSCGSEGKRERPWGSRGSGCRCVCEAGGGRKREGGDQERAKLSCGGARGEGRLGARLIRRARAGPSGPAQ